MPAITQASESPLARALRAPALRRILLALILLLAAVLRLHGISTGLRHVPPLDERFFVEGIAQMRVAHDLEQRYYGYPALFSYLLYPAVASALPAHPTPWSRDVSAEMSEAYLRARVTVALLGVLVVALGYWLGVRMGGVTVGLVTAAFLAVSPVGVSTAHFVRADVALSAAVILFFVALSTVGLRTRGDALAGASLGIACAIKFTGVFLAPCYLLRRVLTEGFSLRKLVLAVLICLLVFAVVSPYSILRLPAQLDGVRLQWDHEHASPDRSGETRLAMMAAYARVWPSALGWPGTLLSVVGMLIVRRRWRAWLPLLALPLVTLAFLTFATAKHDRQMLSTVVVLALLAGEAIAALGRRAPGWATVVALASLVPPLHASVRAIQPYGRPQTRDVVLDWVNEHVAAGSRILTKLDQEIGLDSGRFEVVRVPRIEDDDLPLVREADYVITPPEEAAELLARFPTRFEIRSDPGGGGGWMLVREIPPEARPATVSVPLADARIHASQNDAQIGAAHDGRLDTYWSSKTTQRSGQWLTVELARPVALTRIALMVGDQPLGQARRLGLSVKQGDEWRPVRFHSVRAEAWKQPSTSPRSQVLAFAPVRTSALRLSQRKEARRKWVVAEIELSALPDAPAGTSRPKR